MCLSHKEKEAVSDYQCYFCLANIFDIAVLEVMVL